MTRATLRDEARRHSAATDRLFHELHSFPREHLTPGELEALERATGHAIDLVDALTTLAALLGLHDPPR